MCCQPEHIGHIRPHAAAVGAHELNATADQARDLDASGGRAGGDADDDHTPAVTRHHEGIDYCFRPSQGLDGDVHTASSGDGQDLCHRVTVGRIDAMCGPELHSRSQLVLADVDGNDLACPKGLGELDEVGADTA